MSKDVKEKAGIGSEPFPGEFLKPVDKKVKLLSAVSELLADYYRNAYNLSFTSLSKIHILPPEALVVLSEVNKYGRLRIGSEVFGSTTWPKYIRSTNVLAKFVVDDNGTIDTYPGQVQYFFDHTLNLPDGLVKHSLAFIRWHRPADNTRSWFHC